MLSILPDRAVRTPGWSFLLDTSKFANGMHQLSAVATSEDGQRASISRNIEVANWSATNPIQISIGKPTSNDGALSGTVPAGGWAISNTAPITTVSLTVDGKPIGQAAYGGKRSDVCEVLPGRPGCPNVGWNILLDTTQIGDGMHDLAVTAASSDGTSATTSVSITVSNLSGSNSMRISVDTPSSDDVVLTGSAALGGWAFDSSSLIRDVEIEVDGVPEGNALYGGVRSDVCQVLGQKPGCPNLGWNYVLDTTKFGNGRHMLAVFRS